MNSNGTGDQVVQDNGQIESSQQLISPQTSTTAPHKLVKINADTAENKKIMSIWCSFFLLAGAVYVLTLAEQDINFKATYKGYFYLLDDNLSVKSEIVTQTDHTLEIKCPKGQLQCQTVPLLYYSQIEQPNFAFVMNFKDTSSWPLSNTIDFAQDYVNPDFTGFLLALRYTCLAISIIMMIGFIRKIQRISKSHWVIEHKFIVILSGLLILFNNPFYAITILVQNMASAFFEVLFIVNFFVFLLLFFLVGLDRAVTENGMKESSVLNRNKVIFMSSIYIFLLLTYIGFSYNHLEDPYTDFSDSFGGFFEFCKWVSIILFISYFVVILFLYIKVYQGFSSMIWRNRLFVLFSLYFILCSAIFVFSGSLDIYGSVGNRALLFIAILNLYIYYLQYMYSFSEEGFQEAAQMIDLEMNNHPQIYEMLDESGIQVVLQESTPDSLPRHQIEHPFDRNEHKLQKSNQATTPFQPESHNNPVEQNPFNQAEGSSPSGNMVLDHQDENNEQVPHQVLDFEEDEDNEL